MKKAFKLITFLSLATLALAACAPSQAEPTANPTSIAEDSTAAAILTSVALATEHSANMPTQTPTAAATATFEPSATPPPAPTALPALVSVSQATNCRSGQDERFIFEGVLDVGEQAEVLAKSDSEDYWLIVNPDDPDSTCWLWGAYATVEGQTEDLPIHTPEPTPTPSVGFDVWFHGFASCGSNQLAIFAVHNGGAVRLWSGWIGAYTVGGSQKLYGPILDRHPFSKTATETCPAGHGNELFPGEVNYVLIPLNSPPTETDAYVEFKLCSADHGGGECVTKIGYFYLP
jgi:hypothetical protein